MNLERDFSLLPSLPKTQAERKRKTRQDAQLEAFSTRWSSCECSQPLHFPEELNWLPKSSWTWIEKIQGKRRASERAKQPGKTWSACFEED